MRAVDLLARPITGWTVQKWWNRDNIPAEWLSAVLATDVARDAGLSAEQFLLISGRARRSLDELSEASP